MGCCLNAKGKITPKIVAPKIDQRSSEPELKVLDVIDSKITANLNKILSLKPSKKPSRRFFSSFGRRYSKTDQCSTKKLSSNVMSAVVKRRKSILTSDMNLPILEANSSFLKISETTYPNLISRSFLAKTLKYEQWLQVCTIPGEKVFGFVEGKWRINEDKEETNFEGYLEQENGMRIGSLQVRALGSNTVIPLNNINKAVEFQDKRCILVRIHMGSDLKYIPEGELTLKLVGCQKCSLESILPHYKQISSYIEFFEDFEMDEEERQLFYFVDSLRSFKDSFMQTYLQLDFEQKGSLELCSNLTKMTADFIQPAVNGDVTEKMLDFFRQRFRIKGRIEWIVKKFSFDHYSAHLKAAELLSSSRQTLLNSIFTKIAIKFKRSSREGVYVLVLLS